MYREEADEVREADAGRMDDDATLLPLDAPEQEDEDEREVGLEGYDRSPSTDLDPPSALPRLDRIRHGLIRSMEVLFSIDRLGQVHACGGAYRHSGRRGEYRRAIAEAIALHIKLNGGWAAIANWYDIPSLKKMDALIGLIRNPDLQAELSGRLDKQGPRIKNFAVILPDGKVMAVEALLQAAPSMKATRAAALRLRASLPGEIAGQPWRKSNWSRLIQMETARAVD